MEASVVVHGSRWQRMLYVVRDHDRMLSWGARGSPVGGGWSPTQRTAKQHAAATEISPAGTFAVSPYAPGEFHPRIWRPVHARRTPPVSLDSLHATLQALTNLLTYFAELRGHVEVHRRNNAAFGHRLRELLFLSCTEVEAACRGILKANNYAKRGNWTMADYRKLARPMRLAEWEIALTRHPAYPPVRPFRSWRGTGSLGWYQAYNAVKHDREGELRLANLGNVVAALAGAVVLAIAQFGPEALDYALAWGNRSWVSTEPHFRTFEVRRWPLWSPRQLYIPPLGKKDDWTASSLDRFL